MKITGIYDTAFAGRLGNSLSRQEERANDILDAYLFSISKSNSISDYGLKMYDEVLSKHSAIVNSNQYKAIKQRALNIRQIRESNSPSIVSNIKNTILALLRIK